MMKQDEYMLLKPDWFRLEEPDKCLKRWNFDKFKTYGDYWNDNFQSSRNLIHQLHSLNEVTKKAINSEVEICVFCRPDLTYHDSLREPLKKAMRASQPMVYLPYWQPFRGLNDRFAICVGRSAILAYGQRLLQAEAMCEISSGPLISEKLVSFSLQQHKVSVKTIPNRASRTRLDGAIIRENFDYPIRKELVRRFPILATLKRAIGAARKRERSRTGC